MNYITAGSSSSRERPQLTLGSSDHRVPAEPAALRRYPIDCSRKASWGCHLAGCRFLTLPGPLIHGLLGVQALSFRLNRCFGGGWGCMVPRSFPLARPTFVCDMVETMGISCWICSRGQLGAGSIDGCIDVEISV